MKIEGDQTRPHPTQFPSKRMAWSLLVQAHLPQARQEAGMYPLTQTSNITQDLKSLESGYLQVHKHVRSLQE